MFRNTVPDPVRLAADALSFVCEFNSANPPTTPTRSLLNLENDNGNRHFVYKVFVDAGCFQDNSTSWGLIILNQDNAPILSACRKESILIDSTLAETMGLRW